MKVKPYLVIGLILCVFSLSACAAAPQPYQGQNALQLTPGPGGLPGAYSVPGANGILENAAAPNGAAPTPAQYCPDGAVPNRTRADNIKSQLAGLKEIKDVNVVVIGNSCLVGYTPTDQSADSAATKNMVADTCKQADRSIEGVTCGDTPGLNTRIAQMYNDSPGSLSAGDISTRFNDLVRFINPSLG